MSLTLQTIHTAIEPIMPVMAIAFDPVATQARVVQWCGNFVVTIASVKLLGSYAKGHTVKMVIIIVVATLLYIFFNVPEVFTALSDLFMQIFFGS